MYKAITKLHSNACRDSFFVAEKDSRLGLVYSQDYYAASVIREWFRARPGFRKAQREYLAYDHDKLGGARRWFSPINGGRMTSNTWPKLGEACSGS